MQLNKSIERTRAELDTRRGVMGCGEGSTRVKNRKIVDVQYFLCAD